MALVDRLCAQLALSPEAGVRLLRHREVVQWLFGDLSFLPAADKACEDAWGRRVLRARRPDLKLDKQWTNKFGEHLCEELFLLLGQPVTKPPRREHYQPDGETAEAILEVKTGTFCTRGTACEKILGCPFKYADVAELYGKPLKILCIGGAERLCRERHGNLGGRSCTPKKRRFLEFFEENGVEYLGATDLLRRLLPE